mgnify:CR=1 FL=1
MHYEVRALVGGVPIVYAFPHFEHMQEYLATALDVLGGKGIDFSYEISEHRIEPTLLR